MTKPPARLRNGRDIRAALDEGRRRGGRLLSVHVAAGESTAVAVVASRRVGSAVDRNRAKRLLREAARRVAWQAGRHVVLVARPACATADRPAVSRELRELAGDLDALDHQPADV